MVHHPGALTAEEAVITAYDAVGTVVIDVGIQGLHYIFMPWAALVAVYAARLGWDAGRRSKYCCLS